METASAYEARESEFESQEGHNPGRDAVITYLVEPDKPTVVRKRIITALARCVSGKRRDCKPLLGPFDSDACLHRIMD